MKICFFCDSIFSIGGVQRVLAVVAKELAKTHDVTILTMDEPEQQDLSLYCLHESKIHFEFFRFADIDSLTYKTHAPYSGLYKKILPHNQLTSFWYSKSSFPKIRRTQLIETLNKGNYDVIIGVHAFIAMKLATIRKELKARKVIGWMHNSYDAFFEKDPPYLGNMKSHFKFQMRKLDDIIVLTHTDAKLYQKELHLKAKVIYNPLTLEVSGRCDTESKTFLSVGRMSYKHKGFDILIQAFALFCKENKEWHLIIVGDGPEKENLKQLIQKNKIEDRIHIFPFTDQIQTYYATASVYILASRWEGFPLVLMEALSFGLPIVSSNIPISEEVLKNKDFCSFFKNEDIESLDTAMKGIICKDLRKLSDSAYAYSQRNCTPDDIMAQWNVIISN